MIRVRLIITKIENTSERVTTFDRVKTVSVDGIVFVFGKILKHTETTDLEDFLEKVRLWFINDENDKAHQRVLNDLFPRLSDDY